MSPTTLTIAHTHPTWKFLLLWFIATFIGWVAYVIPVSIVQLALGLDRLGDPQRTAELTTPMFILGAVLCGAACGSTIGLAQWLVLRREIKHIAAWIVATIAGYASIGVLPLIGNAFQPGWFTWAITLIIDGKMHWLARVESMWQNSAWLPGALTLTLFGFVLGIVQWLVLRGRIERAGWWTAISTIGWALAAMLSSFSGATAVFASWMIPMIVSGVGLVWLLRRPAPIVQITGEGEKQ